MKSFCFALAGFLLAVTPVSAAELNAASGGWPQWRGPHRDGLSAETGLNTDWETKKPELIWMADGMGKGYASVSIADGVIYTSGNFDDGQAIVAASAENGSVLWRTSLTEAPPKHGYDGSRTTPTLDGDRLYVVTSDGQIACLLRSGGQVVWKRNFKEDWNGKMMSGWGFSESPLIDGDWVLCTPGGKNAMIVALNKMTGEEVWKTAMPEYEKETGKNGGAINDGAGYASIVVSEGAGVKQYVTLVGRGLIGVRAENGQLLWRYKEVSNGTANIPTPIVSGDYIFASSGYKTGSALVHLVATDDGVDAEEVYFIDGAELQNHHGGMVLVGEHVYLGNGHGKGFPTCVELATGKIVWGGKLRGPGDGSAAVAYYDKHLIFRYQNGEVGLIEATPKQYLLKGSFKPEHVEGPSWAHPVVAGGRLYLREQDKLMCYDLQP
ncbi:MAG: PQQ-like beta-propeller repeat protein [Planctomycetales bacterium]|nr:PQQ-like beta-propeller repeat protein [Planctomycetales bacterium]